MLPGADPACGKDFARSWLGSSTWDPVRGDPELLPYAGEGSVGNSNEQQQQQQQQWQDVGSEGLQGTAGAVLLRGK